MEKDRKTCIESSLKIALERQWKMKLIVTKPKLDLKKKLFHDLCKENALFTIVQRIGR